MYLQRASLLDFGVRWRNQQQLQVMVPLSFTHGNSRTVNSKGGKQWHSWLRHRATSWKVVDWFPDCVTGILHSYNSSRCTMALRSTQPQTEMSTRYVYWGVKAADAYSWQPYHFHVPTVLKSGSLNLLESSEPVHACTWIALPLTLQ
jgi:hypothetical protein